MDADIRLLYGGYTPQFSEKYGPLVGQSIVSKIIRNIENFITPNECLTSHEKSLLRFLKEEKVEVVLAEYGITGARVWRVCKHAGVPLIIHFHGFDAYFYDTIRRYGKSYRAMFEYATFIVGVSRHMCSTLIALGAPPEKVAYNPYGPNSRFFDLRPDYSGGVFVASGRFTDKKAPHITVEAFALALKKCPEIRLVMAGEGEHLEKCKQIVHRLGVSESITFTGALSHDKIMELFSGAAAFLQHSVRPENGDSEGTPVAILEASAAGLPVISTRHAGIPDVVLEEDTGILVEEYDINGYAEAIVRLASDRQLAQKMGERGRARVLGHFTLERHISELDRLIRLSAKSVSCEG